MTYFQVRTVSFRECKDSYASCCIHLLTKELSLITSHPILSCQDIRPGICWCLVAIPWHLRDYGFTVTKRSSWLQEGHIGYGRTKTNNIHIVQHETRFSKGQLSRQLILDSWKLFSKKIVQGMSAAPQDLTYHRGHPNGGPAMETQNSGWSRYIDKGRDGGKTSSIEFLSNLGSQSHFLQKKKGPFLKRLTGGTGVEKQQPFRATSPIPPSPSSINSFKARRSASNCFPRSSPPLPFSSAFRSWSKQWRIWQKSTTHDGSFTKQEMRRNEMKWFLYSKKNVLKIMRMIIIFQQLWFKWKMIENDIRNNRLGWSHFPLKLECWSWRQQEATEEPRSEEGEYILSVGFA